MGTTVDTAESGLARPHLRATMRDGKKDEDEAYDPFAGLDKGSVLQVRPRRLEQPRAAAPFLRVVIVCGSA